MNLGIRALAIASGLEVSLLLLSMTLERAPDPSVLARWLFGYHVVSQLVAMIVTGRLLFGHESTPVEELFFWTIVFVIQVGLTMPIIYFVLKFFEGGLPSEEGE